MPENDNDWVRVTDKDTGHKRSVRESELPHGNYTVLKADPLDELGNPLPAEFNAITPTSGQSADLKKETTHG